MDTYGPIGRCHRIEALGRAGPGAHFVPRHSTEHILNEKLPDNKFPDTVSVSSDITDRQMHCYTT